MSPLKTIDWTQVSYNTLLKRCVCETPCPHKRTSFELFWTNKEMLSFYINPSPNDKILDQSKFKAHADNKNKCDSKFKFCFQKCRKHFGKRRKCWLPAFSPIQKMFSKDLFLKGR